LIAKTKRHQRRVIRRNVQSAFRLAVFGFILWATRGHGKQADGEKECSEAPRHVILAWVGNLSSRNTASPVEVSVESLNQSRSHRRRTPLVELAPYRSPAAREEAVDALANALDAEVHALADSVEGRPIRAVRVPGGDEGAVLICAGIHGVEYIATEVALGALAALRDGDSAWTSLRERADVWVVPSLNPDAYARTWEQGGDGTLPQLRTNARGVDLNRNFPLPAPQEPVWFTFAGWRTGSDDPANSFYRGEQPLSEPESVALAGLLERVRFAASVSLHSTMGTLIPPCVEQKSDYRAYAELCRVFGRAQKESRYRRVANFWLDRFTGELEDFQHATYGTWAVTVEHWPLSDRLDHLLRPPSRLFWRYNPPDPLRWAANDLPGIAAFLHAGLDRGR
jgi:hypothetical protein